ncbi:hypothetical protein [Aeromicrobium sp. NPDC092404]|uniref:hypothetical protein n=1 Tax=Aeromicrobium sp. NPDC092404 TaxID=3154976 RepID=UPI003422C8E2
MRLSKEVTKAIDEFEYGDPESAMAHACMAVDGSAKIAFPHMGVGARFTRFLRDHVDVLERMGLMGLDAADSRFSVPKEMLRSDGTAPDVAELIYSVHRCAHGHGDAVAESFELLPPGDADWHLQIGMEDRSVRLPESVIWGLLGATVLAATNAEQPAVAPYYKLHWQPGRGQQADWLAMPIKDWWGREQDFLDIALLHPRSFLRVTPEGPHYVTVEPGSGGVEIVAQLGDDIAAY